MTRRLLLDSREALGGPHPPAESRLPIAAGRGRLALGPYRCKRVAVLLASGLVGLLLAPALAVADCVPDPPTSGDSVTCTGADEAGFNASGTEGLTIGTSGPTEMNDSDPAVDAALRLSDDNVVTLDFDSTVTVGEAPRGCPWASNPAGSTSPWTGGVSARAGS